jgi:glutamyl-tRNA reductase
LKEKLGSLSENELKRLSKRISESEYQRVEEFARLIEGKYLGMITKQLRDLSKNGQRLEYIDFVNRLFDLKGRGKL